MSEEIDVTLVVLYSIFSTLVLISNSIVVIVVVKSGQLHLPTLWNIAFMAAWDFALGLYFLLLVVPSKMKNAFAYSEELKTPAAILFLLLIDQNVLNIVVALVDRCISIFWPLRYPRLMSSRRFALAVVSVFSINLGRVCLLLDNPNVQYYPRIGVCIASHNFAKFSTFALIFAISTLIVILLITVLVKLWRVRRSVPISVNRVRGTQFTLTICLSTIVFIACFLPVCVAVVWAAIFGGEHVPKFLVKFAIACVLSNSLWNVYIYTFTYVPFKDASLQVLFPSIARERARHVIHLRFQRSRDAIFKVCDSIQ